MQSRFLKQFIYGTLFLAVIAGIAWLGFLGIRGGASCFDGRKSGNETGVDCGGSCVSCEIKDLKPIESPRIVTFDTGGGRISAMIEFRNSNVRFGADPFSYSIVFIGTGGPIATTTRQSFIYPGEVKFIVQSDVAAPAAFTRAKVETTNPFWHPAEVFVRPHIVEREIEIELRSEDREAVISGFASNESPFELGEVVVHIAVTGSTGGTMGAARTVIDSLDAGEERFFKVVVPGISLPSISRDSVRISFEARRK
ncbi:MAG: hypothetical protein AAB518_03395 [Patescibacteria group bacterium]